MPTDAKCGLLVGVGVVVAVAVLFFQMDPPTSPPPAAAVRAPALSHPSDKTILPQRPASATTGRGH